MEGRLADMSGHLKAFTAVAESLTGLPVEERAVILQGMQALIAAELMRLTIEGGTVLDHLPAVDRAIRAVSAQARGENMEARVKLDTERLRLQAEALQIRRANDEIRADDRRQKKEEAEERRRENEKAKAEAEAAETEAEGDEESGMTEDEKSAALLERAFGKPPPHVLAMYPFMVKNAASENTKAETGDDSNSANPRNRDLKLNSTLQ